MRGSIGAKGLNVSTPTERPTSIVRFEQLSYLVILLSIASWPLNWSTIRGYFNEHPVGYPIGICAGLGLAVLFIWLIARKRKNWARWTYAILTVTSLPFSVLDVSARFDANAAAAMAYSAGYLILLVAVLLLFTREARNWFSSKSGASAVG
jgi:hypothetical protein